MIHLHLSDYGGRRNIWGQMYFVHIECDTLHLRADQSITFASNNFK